jgi:hypothetical protein
MLKILSRTVETLNSGQDTSVAECGSAFISDPLRIRIQMRIRFRIQGIDDQTGKNVLRKNILF